MLHRILIQLSEYNRVMNAAVYAAAEKLTDEQRRKDQGAFFKSVHATLNHLLWADKNWLRRFIMAGHHYDRLPASLYANIEGRTSEYSYEIHAEFTALRADRFQLDSHLVNWVTYGLSEEKLGQTLHYKNAKGQESSRLFADVLMHVFNHQTHHRGQITTLLTQQGIDVGITDLIYHSAKS